MTDSSRTDERGAPRVAQLIAEGVTTLENDADRHHRRALTRVGVAALALTIMTIAPLRAIPAGADGNEAPGAPLAFRSISGGDGHACAIDDAGDVRCWGRNDAGQLGQGDTDNRGDDPGEMGAALPAVELGSGRSATAVSAGAAHTCVILDDATVRCWGRNSWGQLGLGDTDDRGDGSGEMGVALAAVDLGPGRSATALTSQGDHTCALLDNASVKCWGRNSWGQLGLGDTDDRGDGSGEMGVALAAVDLGPGRTASAVSAGSHHTCAILDDGSIKCWGLNVAGGLGLGDTASRGDQAGEMGQFLPAVELGTGRSAQVVAAGTHYTCAILDDATVKCWGHNEGGQLGLGNGDEPGRQSGEMGDALLRVDLGIGRTVRALAVHGYSACALLDDETLRCWGNNHRGQLGYGDASRRGDGPAQMGAFLPALDLGAGRTAEAVTLGDSSSCALLDDGALLCWGDNSAGQLGSGDVEHRGDGAGEMGDALQAIDVPRMTRAVTPAPDPGPTPPVVPEPTPISEPAPAPTCMGRAATIVGGPNRMRIVGTRGDDVIVTRNRGGVTIIGRGGNDIICGSAGRDTIRGGAGNDRISGLAGNDRLFGNAGRDVIHGGPGRDTCDGGPARDRARACETTRRLR